MPTYTFITTDTGESENHFFTSWKDKDAYLEEHSNLKQKLTTPGFITDHKTTLSKAGDGWKDVLKKVKSGSGRNNTIKD